MAVPVDVKAPEGEAQLVCGIARAQLVMGREQNGRSCTEGAVGLAQETEEELLRTGCYGGAATDEGLRRRGYGRGATELRS